MLIRIRDLAGIKDEKRIDVDVDSVIMENDPYLKRLEKVKGYILFYYDYDEKLKIEYKLKGIMICPEPFTLDDVSVKFSLDEKNDVCFSEMEEGFLIRGDTELNDLLLNICLPEVPIKVEKQSKTSYHYGDSWSVMSEEEYDMKQKDRIDPRLAKLLDYKEED